MRGTRIARISVQGLYILTMNEIGAYGLRRWQKERAAGEGKLRGGGNVAVVSYQKAGQVNHLHRMRRRGDTGYGTNHWFIYNRLVRHIVSTG